MLRAFALRSRRSKHDSEYAERAEHLPGARGRVPLRPDVDWIRGEGHEVNDRQNSKHPSDSTEDGAAQRQVRLLHARPPPEQVLDAEQDHTQHLDDREGILERGISIDGGICRREDEGDVENDEDEDGELDGPRHLDERSVTIFHLQASATAKHFTVFLHATHTLYWRTAYTLARNVRG